MIHSLANLSVIPPDEYTHTKPKFVGFKGKWQQCTDWNKLLPQLCANISTYHYDSTTLDLLRAEFYESAKDFHAPNFADSEEDGYDKIDVEGLNLYVDTDLSAKDTVRQARTLINYFGYPDSELLIVTE